MKLSIGPYSIIIRRIQKTKTVSVDIMGQHIAYQVLGEDLTLLEGTVPEDLKPQLERTIKIHFRTKI